MNWKQMSAFVWLGNGFIWMAGAVAALCLKSDDPQLFIGSFQIAVLCVICSNVIWGRSN